MENNEQQINQTNEQLVPQTLNQVFKAPDEKPKKWNFNKKRLVLALGLLIVIAVSGTLSTFYLNITRQTVQTSITQNPIAKATTAQDPMAGWKSYTNTIYNYSLKYPSDWDIRTDGKPNPNTFKNLGIYSTCKYTEGGICQSFTIEVGASNGTLNPQFIVIPEWVISKHSTKVAGENANQIVYHQSWNSGELLQKYVILNHSNLKFTFKYSESQQGKSYKTAADWQKEKIFEDILSTLKFSNPTSPTPTITLIDSSTWKSLTDSQYDFQFKYPFPWKLDTTIVDGYAAYATKDCNNNFLLNQDDIPCKNSTPVGGEFEGFKVFINDNPNHLTAKEYGDEYVNNFFKNYPNNEDTQKLINESLYNKIPLEVKFYNDWAMTRKAVGGAGIIEQDAFISTGDKMFELLCGKCSDELMNQFLLNFSFTNQISPTPSCKTRPACLDAIPSCRIAVTADMCPPKATPTP